MQASRRRGLRLSLSATVLAAGVGLLTTAPAAEAHYFEGRRSGWAYRHPVYCVNFDDVQNHSYHWLTTVFYGSNCGRPTKTGIDNIIHFKEHYKTRQWGTAGTFCFKEGWFKNGVVDHWLHTTRSYDIWPWCNFGNGVHVYITMDSWHYARNGYYDAYRGNWYRPATAHCHCP